MTGHEPPDETPTEGPDGHTGADLDAAFSIDAPVDAPADVPAGVPPRGAFVLVFVAVVLAGFFGAVIGYGLTDISTDGNSPAVVAIGTLIGAVGAALGVGIVATLMLRAMSEWNTGRRRAR